MEGKEEREVEITSNGDHRCDAGAFCGFPRQRHDGTCSSSALARPSPSFELVKCQRTQLAAGCLLLISPKNQSHWRSSRKRMSSPDSRAIRSWRALAAATSPTKYGSSRGRLVDLSCWSCSVRSVMARRRLSTGSRV